MKSKQPYKLFWNCSSGPVFCGQDCVVRVKPCEICGDAGVVEAIITCSRCKSTREHLYCMRVCRTDVPQFWDCDECLGNKLVSTKSTITKQTPEAAKKRVPSFSQKSPRVNEGPNKNALPNRFNFKEKSVDTGRTKYLSCDEVAKLSSGANKLKSSPRKEIRSSHVIPKSMPPPRERTPVKSSQIERGNKSESDLQKLVGKPSTGTKVTFCESPKISKRIETTCILREPKIVKFEVPSPITVETDVAMDVDVAKSSEILAKTGVQSGTTIGGKNDAELGAGSSDGGKPILTSPLAVCETFGPYIPALISYWKGNFTLPNDYGKYNDEFLAHPPSRVHIKVFETTVKMPKSISFELAPNRDVYMELFSGSVPDKDDIGLYFFPSSHSMTIADFLWSKNLLMQSVVNDVELLVFSSKLLKPCLQEFQGKCFLWGVFRCRKNSKPVIEAPFLLEDKSECRDDVPPGFESVADALLILEDKSERCDDVPPGFESVADAPVILQVKDELCGDVPPGFERIWKPKS
ncbi:zinc finger, RING/FYVE/PHD-type [Artemisia annua]|uniref:Zinc finger, RING/FYVE/PHD-type n=1 Tax=Artemisia annua TaxID=35608 RepID=A0A2U1PW30_ARTAN|nr:zinc finger, RING/FYVE/PHD-type [Artemisia annua]